METLTYVLFLVLSTSFCSADERCPGDLDTELNLSIAAHRNATGHSIVSVNTERADPWNVSERGIVVDVRHNSAICAATRYTRMNAVYVSPPDVEYTSTHIQPTVSKHPQYTAAIMSTTSPPVPPAGYEHHPGLGYYKFHPDGLVWEQSRDKCVQEGAHLIILNSKQEAELFKEMGKQKKHTMRGVDYTNWLFAGVSDLAQEGHWTTVLGERLENAGFVNWWPGQPSDGTIANCMNVHIDDALMNDADCKGKHAFICEWSPLE